jgi:hypothetical protein
LPKIQKDLSKSDEPIEGKPLDVAEPSELEELV